MSRIARQSCKSSLILKSVALATLALLTVVGLPSSKDIEAVASTPEDTVWVNFNAPEDFPFRYGRNSSELTHWDRPYNVRPVPCDSAKLDREDGCSLSKPVKFVADLIAPNCEVSNQEFCLKSFSVSELGFKLDLYPDGEVQGPEVAPVKSLGLPAGSSSSLWSGRSTSGETVSFMVTPKVQMIYTKATGRFLATTFSLEVIPYIKLAKPGAEWLASGNSFAGSRSNTATFAVPSGCEKAIWISDGYCGISVAHDPNMEFKLAVQLPKSLKGWFQANLSGPEISMRQAKKHQTLEVTAAPGESSVVMESGIPRAAIASNRGLSYVGNFGTQISGYGLTQYFPLAIDWSVALAKILKDVPTSIAHPWLLQTMAVSDSAANNYATESSVINRCVQSTQGVVGIVNSNAMAADPTPPRLINGFLTYQLADFHFLPDGKTPKVGRYFMAIRDDFARCIYNTRSIPISASIQVVGDNKATAISRKTQGWHQLSVDGFTYSKKTIKVKFKRASR